MFTFFLNLVNMSITASWLALAVILLRLLLKKAPKAISVALWAIVAVRLIFPFSIESVLSLVPSAKTIPQEIVFAKEPVIDSGVDSINRVVNPIITETFAPSNELTSINPIQVFFAIAENLWILGMLAMAMYALISYVRLRMRVREAVKTEKNIYICDNIPSPFILGVICPRIILPSSMNKEDIEYVVAHERAHLRRLDHLWKPLGFLLLSVYWFNPILWIAYILLCRDIELACDERVIRDMNADDKKAYSTALLNCSMPRRMISACPLAFGEVGVKKRIKSVLNYKKPAFWIIIVSTVLTVALAVGFLTNPKEKDYSSLPDITAHTYEVSEVVYTAPYISFVYFAGHNTPFFTITQDYDLLYKEADDISNNWKNYGKLEEVELSKSNFDVYFDRDVIIGWKDGMDEKQLRNDNAKAWKLSGDGLRFVLLQEDGSVYTTLGTSKIHHIFKLEANINEDTGLIAVSGEKTAVIKVFSTEDSLEKIKNEVNWLDITFSDDSFTPFDIYCDGAKQLGFFNIYNASTFESLDFFRPSGLSPHTYIFQNASDGGEYIITMQGEYDIEEGSTALLCFGARLPGEPVTEAPKLEVPPVIEMPDGRNSMQFFTWTVLPENPQEISSVYFFFERNGDASYATGDNIDYLDNLMLSDTDSGDFVLSFSIYQDVLPYINPLFSVLNSIVTVDYEGKVLYDKNTNPNDFATITMNNMAGVISEVKLGAGNGHRDFYFTFSTDRYIEFKDITEFKFSVNQAKAKPNAEISINDAPVLLESGEISIYPTVLDKDGNYKEFVLKVGNKYKAFVGECDSDDSWHRGMYIEDLTGDGADDITVTFQIDHGTGTHREDIHIFDGVTLEEYGVERLYDTIEKYVSFYADEDMCHIEIDGEFFSIDKMSFYPDYDKKDWWDKPMTENLFYFSVADGLLKIELPCQYTTSGVYGSIFADYEFKNNEFVFMSAEFKA